MFFSWTLSNFIDQKKQRNFKTRWWIKRAFPRLSQHCSQNTSKKKRQKPAALQAETIEKGKQEAIKEGTNGQNTNKKKRRTTLKNEVGLWPRTAGAATGSQMHILNAAVCAGVASCWPHAKLPGPAPFRGWILKYVVCSIWFGNQCVKSGCSTSGFAGNCEK